MNRLISVMLGSWILIGVTYARTPITYRHTIQDINGTRHRVDFVGDIEPGRLTGVLRVDGRTIEIVAHVGKDGSVSGSLDDRASVSRGTFSGVLDKDHLLGGRFNLGAHAGRWRAPGFIMPSEALSTSDEGVF